jgi:hypothetical protein
MISSRRNFLFGVGAVLVAAPTIVRASSLMPVKQMLGDGVALQSAYHPWNNNVAADLTENSLLQLMEYVRESWTNHYPISRNIETIWLDPEKLKQSRGGFRIGNFYEQVGKAGIRAHTSTG